VIKRNGRTSAHNPPIQQTPRKGGFREIFKASPGHVLVALDYDFIELCTLAAVCKARYGFSVLADVIIQGIDPHCFTAAMIEGVPLTEFMTYKDNPELKKKFSSLRQQAKAINFGIPSGLTANGLSVYAQQAYGVSLGPEGEF
jgi:DNA polymerase I-like protein with 3'-5' exonuclease and polymerase domains